MSCRASVMKKRSGRSTALMRLNFTGNSMTEVATPDQAAHMAGNNRRPIR